MPLPDHPADIAQRTATDIGIGGAAVMSPLLVDALARVDVLATQVTIIGGAVLVLWRIYGLLVDVWRGRRQKLDAEADED